MLKPLHHLEDWMKKKVKLGKGTFSRDGNGSSFWDFETMDLYSPYDHETLTEDRSFEIEDQEAWIKQEYQIYTEKYYKNCSCDSLSLFRYGCKC